MAEISPLRRRMIERSNPTSMKSEAAETFINHTFCSWVRSERLFTVLRLDQIKAGISKQIAEYLPIIFLIFNYEDALAHRSSPLAGLGLGQ